MYDPDSQSADSLLNAARLRGYRWMVTPVLLFALSRAAIVAVTVFSLVMEPQPHIPVVPIDNALLIQGLTRWDGGWFIRIAQEGYAAPENANFFPLFPLLGRYASQLLGLSVPTALVLISNVCSLAALLVVYRIYLELASAPAATAALALLVAWPFHFFHAAAYPESIAMLATALAVYLGMHHRHHLAGIALGLGILSRHLSAVGGVALIAQHVKERGWRPRRLVMHRDAIALILPAAIVCIYFAFLQWRFGNWHLWIDVRHQWGNYAWWGLGDLFAGRVQRPPEIILYVVLSVIPGVGAALLLTRKHWHVLAALGLIQMLLLWAIGLAGLGRYCAGCWPAFLPLGVLLSHRRGALCGMVCGLAMLQGLMLYLFVHLYPIM